MSSVELAVATLRSLPEAFQGQAVEFIHQLHAATRQERQEALRKTAGCLTGEEADAMERTIKESFEHVDGASLVVLDTSLIIRHFRQD